jgi:thioredoxin reductase (NADPH)
MNDGLPTECDVAVIGGGVAGLAAAAEAAAGGASVVCLDPSPLAGGLVANLGRVEDFPAAADVSGPGLADLLGERARRHGAAIVQAQVRALLPDGDSIALTTDLGPLRATAVVVATGARLRRLGVPGEAELAGRGVSQCDWCDGGLFRNKPVVVVGAGDAGLQAALHLADVGCSSVTIVTRGERPRARRDLVLRAADDARISFHWQTEVEAVLGDGGVRAVRLREAGQPPVEVPCDGVFVFVGLQANTAFMPEAAERDPGGRLITDAALRTTMRGVYAAGAVRSGHAGPVVAAMGEAVLAARRAVFDVEAAREP